MSDRPMVNLYEPDAAGVDVLVYRPMNDLELAQLELDQAAAVAAAAAPLPTPDERMAAAIGAAVAAAVPGADAATLATVAQTSLDAPAI